jgi:hypothetical protein
VWLEVNHTETLLDHMDWEGEIREMKCLLTLVKGMDLSSPTHRLRSLSEYCTP